MAKSTTITISLHQGNLTVSIHSHKMATKDDVTWDIVPAGTPFVVCFVPETPFGAFYFTDSKSNSGQPKVLADKNKRYKYMVVAHGQMLDPDVIVDT